jgi:hypothetical protein
MILERDAQGHPRAVLNKTALYNNIKEYGVGSFLDKYVFIVLTFT